MEENPVHYPCLKYEKAVKNLFKKVKKATTLSKIRQLFIEFNKKYTVIDSVWRSWGREELKEDYKDYDENKVLNRIENIKKVALQNFYLWDCLNFNNETFTKGKVGRTFFWHFLNNFSISSNFDPFKAETLITALIYPHDRLKDIYCFAKKRFNYPIPKLIQQKYKNAKNEYEKISVNLPFYSNYFSDKQLFIVGLKNYANFGEKLIVIENFECAIGLFPCKKEIWKMYFNYLKSQKEEKKRLLNLYSRYCRFFIDDLELQNEFCIELEKQSLEGKNVAKWWIDLAEIVKDFVGIEAGRGILERGLKCSKQESLIKYGLWFEKEYGTIDQYMTRYLWSIKIYPHLKNLHNIVRDVPNLKTVIKFNHKIDYPLIDKSHEYLGATFKPRKIFPPKPQTFPFRSSIISYIEKYANYTVSLKLFQSAKYFFFLKKSSPFCHNLTILNDNEKEDRLIFYPHSLFFTPAYIDYSTPKFTVTNGIFIFCKNSPNLFSILIPKMNFKIKHLILTNQILSFHDFEFIIELKLKSVKFDKANIYKDGDKIDELSIEEIIFMLDGVKDLSLLQIPSKIPLHLNKIQRTIKLKVFEISELNEHFNFYDFMEFAKMNIRKDAKIVLHFTETVTKEQKHHFDKIMQKEFPDVKFYNK